MKVELSPLPPFASFPPFPDMIEVGLSEAQCDGANASRLTDSNGMKPQHFEFLPCLPPPEVHRFSSFLKNCADIQKPHCCLQKSFPLFENVISNAPS